VSKDKIAKIQFKGLYWLFFAILEFYKIECFDELSRDWFYRQITAQESRNKKQ
jgi:hypothetical protein